MPVAVTGACLHTVLAYLALPAVSAFAPAPLPSDFTLSSLPSELYKLVHDLSKEQLAALMKAADYLHVDGLVAVCGAALAVVARGMKSAVEVRSFFLIALPTQLARVVASYSDFHDMIQLNHQMSLKKAKLDLTRVSEVEVHFEEYKCEDEADVNPRFPRTQRWWAESHVLTYKKRKASTEFVPAEFVPSIPMLYADDWHVIDEQSIKAIEVCNALNSGGWSVDNVEVARAASESVFVKRCKKVVLKRGDGWALGDVLQLDE